MDHHADLAHLVDAHACRGVAVEDFVHHLDLAVVVARAERAELRQAALLGALADLGRVGVEHAAELFAVLLVLGPCVAFAHTPKTKLEEARWGAKSA